MRDKGICVWKALNLNVVKEIVVKALNKLFIDQDY